MRISKLFLLLLAAAGRQCLAQDTVPDNDTVASEDATTTPTPTPSTPASFDLESNLRAVIDRVFKEALPVVYRFSSGSSASPECTAALLKLVLSIRKLQPWALRMLDAMGRPPAGIFEGTITDFGSFDQCLEVRAENSWGDEDFRGMYCSLFLKPNIDTSKPVEFLRRSRRVSSIIPINATYSHCLRVIRAGGNVTAVRGNTNNEKIAVNPYIVFF